MNSLLLQSDLSLPSVFTLIVLIHGVIGSFVVGFCCCFRFGVVLFCFNCLLVCVCFCFCCVCFCVCFFWGGGSGGSAILELRVLLFLLFTTDLLMLCAAWSIIYRFSLLLNSLWL